MADVREEVDSLVEEKPQLESDIEVLLKADEDGPWTFDEVPIDSGTFGEIVSREIVEERDDGYRLTDPESVRGALNDEVVESESGDLADSLTLPFPDINRRAVFALIGTLALVAITRVVFMWGSVFRGEYVVLAGNDPWGYRYHVEQLLATDLSLFAFGSLSEYLGTGLAQDHLYVIVAWWTAELIGATPRAAGLALAWLPVVSAVLTAVLVYLIAIRLTADRRTGLTSVALLALTPAHAYRTALGFGDHHAFDYLWLTLTAYALIVLATEHENASLTDGSGGISLSSSQPAWAGAGFLAIGITAQSLAWRAGPLLYLPVGGYAVYRAISDVRTDSSPLLSNAPLIAGIAIAALLSTLPLTVWGWSLGWIRSFAPTLLLGGVVGVLLLGEIGYRMDLSTKTIGGGTVAVGVASFAIAWVLLSGFTATIGEFLGYLERTGQSSIAETASLFSGELGNILGPILILGFMLYLALPYAGYALWRAYRNHRPEWSVIGIYVVYFLFLATVQLRFAGQLSVFIVVFAGIGFVHLASAVDLTTRPQAFNDQRPFADGIYLSRINLPDRASLWYLFVLFLLVTSIGMIQIPIKQGQLAVEDDTYQAATWIASNASNLSQSNSGGYVLSNWGRNRIYNYFLDGDSESYWYAGQNYADFLRSTDGLEWYNRLSKRNTSVVTESTNISALNSLQVRLHKNHGSETAQSEPLSHYRLQYISENGDQKVFSLVPGAGIVGRAPPNETIILRTNQTVSGTTFTYERTVRTTENGWYGAIVPYPGRYTGVNDTYVSETAVTNGRFITSRSEVAHWPLEASRGSIVFDVKGGNHARKHGASWVRTDDGHALLFDGDDAVVVDNASKLWSDEFTLTIRFRTRSKIDYLNETKWPRLVSTAPNSAFRNTSGYTLALAKGKLVAAVGNGEEGIRIQSKERIDDANWHQARLVRDENQFKTYLDGELIGSGKFTESIKNDNRFVIGATTGLKIGFVGEISSVRFKTNITK